MSLAFSRRSFLKYSAVAAVAVAGASLFSGCDQTDTKNLYCDGAGSITVLQINAVLGTYDDNAKKYKDIDLTKTPSASPSRSPLAAPTTCPSSPATSRRSSTIRTASRRQSMLVEPATSLRSTLPCWTPIWQTALSIRAPSRSTPLWLRAKAGLYLLPRPAVCRVFHELGSGSCRQEGRELRLYHHQVISPTYIPSRPGKPGGFLRRRIGKVSQFFFKFSAILYLVHTRIF